MGSGHGSGATVIPVSVVAGAGVTVQVTLTVPVPTGNTKWWPPMGIPAAAFGIDESHTIYRGQVYEYASGPGPYNDAGNGPYTHYVDNTSNAALDVINVGGKPVYNYGTADRPRLTVPTSLPAGSVVEVHGGPYWISDFFRISGQGTRAAPIFIRGVGEPRFVKKMSVYSAAALESTYIIVEGLDLYKFEVIAPASGISLRDCNVQGDLAGGGVGIDSFASGLVNHDLVFFRNRIHDNGDWQADYDQDVHGLAVGRRTHHVWIVDNEFYHNSGDGVQVSAGSLAAMPETHHIYLGRNSSHHNKQSGLWCKQAADVIVSQNVAYGLRPIGTRPSAFGTGLGFQYGPERVWFLYNRVYDCCYGISSGSTSGLGDGQDVYCIGNVIHDIHHDPNYAYNPLTAWSNAGISLVGTVNKYIIHNTIVDCDAGINSPSGGRMVMVDNIVANISEAQGNHIFVEDGGAAAASTLSNCLLYQGGSDARIRWGGGVVYSLPAFQAAFGLGAGCGTADPLFGEPSRGDYSLRAGSPAIDAGIVSSVYATYEGLYGVRLNADCAGVARPQGFACDIGAFERPAR